jgi:hypothetical protein
MFICNHCPYVQARRERIARDTRELLTLGIHSVAIMPNDSIEYPEDSLDNMRRVAEQFAFPFPYLFDESQEVARNYGAVCTPDFFGYNNKLQLQYRGRLDANDGYNARIDAGDRYTAPSNAQRELFMAMKLVAETGQGPNEQIPSIGCSIKWRSAQATTGHT